MMAQVLVNESSLQSIANAIRSKNGTTKKYTPAEMSTAITALSSGWQRASGSVTLNGDTNTLTITGLGFKVRSVVMHRKTATNNISDYWCFCDEEFGFGARGTLVGYRVTLDATKSDFVLTATGIAGSISNALFAVGTWNWYAYGV